MINRFIRFKIIIKSSCISNAMHVIMTNSLVYYNLSFDKNGDAIITVPSTMRKQYIELFNQKNKIKVNETGTAAISYQQIEINYATGSMMNISDPFIVDRPFIFMINNGAFMGIINDPTQKGDSF